MTPSSTGRRMVEEAIRAGCAATDAHLKCTWPQCACKILPPAFRVSLITALRIAREHHAKAVYPDDRAARGIYEYALDDLLRQLSETSHAAG